MTVNVANRLEPQANALPLGRHSVSWRVNAEPVVFLGGGRALLLQVAHPKVAAGVEQHSTYVTDPWARLFRTVDVMMKLTFGTPSVSAAQARMLACMHRRVVGTSSEGEPYSALDPELLLWVWATLCDTALLMYEQVFSPLTITDRDRYYAEWQLVAHACGIPVEWCPHDWAAFQAYVAGVMANDLRVTPEARKVAHAIAVPPAPWPVGRLAALPNGLITAGLLPAGLRQDFGFPWDTRRERRLRALFSVIRVQMRMSPRPVRDLGALLVIRRQKPLRVPWLQRRGAAITSKRMADLNRDR